MVSVIILSYNTASLTLKCLEYLSKSKNVDLEIIVVDNASSDNSSQKIKSKFPQVRLISNSENVGFAAGNNQAMKVAKGDAFLLLNSDCFVHPDTIATCYSLLKSGEFDVIGCRLLNPDQTIQHSWGYFPTLWRIFLLMTFIDNLPVIKGVVSSIHTRDLARYKNQQSVDWVTGALVMLDKKVFAKIGGIDEKYFMYGEEMEWMYRAKKAGFKVGYTPRASATHLGGASTKSEVKRFVSEFKGYLYWFKKHEPAWKTLILKLILVGGSLYKAFIWKVVGKQSQARDNWETFLQITREVF